MAKLDELKDMFEAYAENYDDLKDAVNDFAKYRQSKEREQRKKTRENELIYSTVRGKYGDRDDASDNLPETELVASTIPTAEKWEGDAKDAITYAELEKLLEQEYAAQALAEQMGDRDAFELYLNGSSSGDKNAKVRLSMDNDIDLEKEWEKEQKRRKTAEKEKSLKPVELRAKEYPSKTEAFLFGYDPGAEGEGIIDRLENGEMPSIKETASEAAYFVPVVGEVKYGANLLDRIGEGGMPGFIETAMAVPFFGPRIKRGAQAFYKAYKAAPAKRFAKKWNDRQNLTPLDYARTQLFDREGKLLGEW